MPHDATKKRSTLNYKNTWFYCLLFVLANIHLTGCSPYQLRGRVVMGNQSQVLAVSPKDNRLTADPIENAIIELTLDPSSISPQQLGQLQTNSQGDFVIDVDAMGAGSFQEYQLGILVTAKNHRNIWQTIKLPAADKYLLIIMTTGSSGPAPPKDILKESLDLKDLFMNQ